MTAADVVYSLERLLAPATHSPGAEFFHDVAGARAFVAGTAPHVAGLVAETPQRLTIVLERPDRLLLDELTMPFAAPVDREAVERAGQGGFARAPGGSGPFRLARWDEGRTIRLERNPHYWRPDHPRVDAVEVAVGLSDQLAWFRLQRGLLDLAAIPPAEWTRVARDARWTPLVVRGPTMRTQYLGLNCDLPPFDRVPVRQAVARAVDPGAVAALLEGRAEAAHGILPPTMPGWDPALRLPPPDPAASRAALAGADVGPVTLWVQRDDAAVRIAQLIQWELHQVGVAVAVKPIEFAALIDAVRAPGRVPMFLLGWQADFPDPANFLRVLLHSEARGTNNNTFFADPAVDAILDAAERTTDPDRRLRLFHAAERRILAAAPWVPLYNPITTLVRHPRVRDATIHPLRPMRWDDLWLAW